MGYAILLLYGLTINLICLFFRRRLTGDSYLIGGRAFGAVFVAFGLFTLLSGGDLVTNTSLGRVYGIYGFALFLGTALGFFLLAARVKAIRRDYDTFKPISIPDYFHSRYGEFAGWIGFGISFLAFFGLLVLQFIAAGSLLAPILNIDYLTIVIAVGIIASSYIAVSGFRAVMGTDLLQGVMILLLLPLLLIVTFPGSIEAAAWFPLDLNWWELAGMTFAGFVSALASADVWQRAYAAKSLRSARMGFIAGGVLIGLLGLMLVVLGVFASSYSLDPNEAFSQVLSAKLPKWMNIPAALLILSVIVSTIDTEIFLLGGLLERQIGRLQGVEESDLAAASSLARSRLWVVGCTAAAVLMASLLRDLVTLYGWLLSLSLVIGPVCLMGLFINLPGALVNWLLGGGLLLLLIAGYTGSVTVDTSFVIAIPGIVVLVLYLAAKGARGRLQ